MQQRILSIYHQQGNAALEVMLLIPIILVILTLLVNMGYNGVRHRHAQAALRLGAFQYIDGLAATDKAKSLQQAQGSVSQKQFSGESNPVKLSASGQTNPPSDLPKNDGILAGASFRQSVGVSVKRDAPYDILPDTPIKGNITLAANTFTFCEMKDDDFKGGQMSALNALKFIGSNGLWLFGGCGGSAYDFSCSDKCQ